jgi:hypothetical protein
VKHLLIILISILLLSSPVTGQETGVLYLYESSSGFVLKSFGDGKVQPKYKGEITNGNPNGFGVLTYPYGEKSVVGEWKNGKEWNTKHTKKDGTILGKFENGIWNKMGVLYLDKRYGKYAWYEDDDGDNAGKYEGYFKDWIRNIHGKFTHSDGGIYIGGWKNGKKEGQGSETWPNGRMFFGEYRNGVTWNGKIFDKTKSIIRTVVNGKIFDKNGSIEGIYDVNGKYKKYVKQ